MSEQDLELMSEEQRQEYIKAICRHLEIPYDLNLVALIRMDGGDGPAHLTPYIKRGGAEILRNNLDVDITSLTSQVVSGSVLFTAVGISKKLNRQEIATGVKYIDGLSGTALDNALMTAQTRSLRRLSLQFVGSGILDESEVYQGKIVTVSQQASVLCLVPVVQPAIQPSNAPGKDITPPKAETAPEVPERRINSSDLHKPNQEEFEAQQAKLRADAIAQLNAKTATVTAEPKKGRKPRVSKTTVDLGPSEPVQQVVTKPPVSEGLVTQPAPIAPPSEPVQVTLAPVEVGQVAGAVATAPAKPRLTPEQVKPYRQRLFRLVNDYLEPAGMTPREGMGNSDKMKALAAIMFPDTANLAELTQVQWEEYLSNLEKRAQANPKETVKYIEETIGL